MPVYEYRCRACGNTFCALVASSDTPEKDIVCPRCTERRAEKLLSMKAAVIGGHRPLLNLTDMIQELSHRQRNAKSPILYTEILVPPQTEIQNP